MRRSIRLFALLCLAACSSESLDFREATIADLQDQMHRGKLSSEQLVNWYLRRIENIDRNGPQLNAILEVDPDALQTARAFDEERQQRGPRGPMHGIPVILKANIDTAGPMARSVRDAAILLGAMTGVDNNDPASARMQNSPPGFTANLTADGLSDKRIGVIRSYYGAGSNSAVERILEQSIEALKSGGAEVVDSIEIDTSDMNDAEYTVLLYEFKADLNKYLAASNAPLSSLADIIEFNEANSDAVMPIFGQDVLIDSQSKGPLSDDTYLQALETSKRVAKSGIDNMIAEHQLDALIAPTNGPAWLTDHINGDTFHIGSSSLAAVSGYPSITVPAGFVSDLPIGLSFIGRANSDKLLIEIAYAFEQLTTARRAPEL
jgi:amidase